PRVCVYLSHSIAASVPSDTSSTRDPSPGTGSVTPSDILPSTSNSDEDPLAGISLPEGVDPSFLAALPEDIRREVLQNQLGIRPPNRVRERERERERDRERERATAATVATAVAAAAAASLVGTQPVSEVSPEFLAALPPAIQEEVRTSLTHPHTHTLSHIHPHTSS
uniref:Uncharacterized protein n=1 Tax=Callorhinchus milii TaxID=7868 RepID=A0A4W3GBK5_CALMI